MTVKDFLRQIRLEQKQIRKLKDCIDAKMDMLTSIGASYSPRLGQSPPDLDKMARTNAEIADLKRMIEHDVQQHMDSIQEAWQMIEAVENPTFRHILEHYYICGETWEEVAENVDYSLRQVYTLHGRALWEVGKIYERLH